MRVKNTFVYKLFQGDIFFVCFYHTGIYVHVYRWFWKFPLRLMALSRRTSRILWQYLQAGQVLLKNKGEKSIRVRAEQSLHQGLPKSMTRYPRRWQCYSQWSAHVGFIYTEKLEQSHFINAWKWCLWKELLPTEGVVRESKISWRGLWVSKVDFMAYKWRLFQLPHPTQTLGQRHQQPC